jgi:signal transduction histidine kinase
MGMAPEVAAKVFDRFFRADNSATRNIGGTGLGLALVKEIVTAHKGNVWVESTLGQGSAFFFTLPIAEQSRTSLEPVSGKSLQVSDWPWTGPRLTVGQLCRKMWST